VHKGLAIILICLATLSAFGQKASSNYQVGTITAVTPHQNAPTEAGNEVVRYDVSVKIGNTVYLVLYTPPHGAKIVEYSPGIDMLFLVGSDTLTFNSKISGKTAVPILRRETLPATSGLDWSKARSQYFSMKIQHLSEILDLTEDQQLKIKPAVEQETAEANQVLGNPVISRKDQLKRYEKIVQSSDEKIKPILTQVQVDKLQDLRKGQKEQLKDLLSKQK